ncbi:MAG: crossover junction endodeoxyribonuclease RuvC [Candidatus Liptonbacteria bacterium]|nr:crossover junction endodeoxyribonuclease RuvC [Candidatus Liptonbacteria bacterium]
MTILGIDPGTSRIGYGVVKKNNGRISFVDAGILKIRPRRAGGRARFRPISPAGPAPGTHRP